MPTSILSSFETGRRALLAHQQTLSTIGHNLANAATPGYSRQRVELAPVNPRLGVEVVDIRRFRDAFVDAMALNETAVAGHAESRHATLRRLEAVFGDVGETGLGAVLDQFFDAFQVLAVRPTDQALRVTALDQAQRVAATFQQVRGRLDQLADDLTVEIQQRVGEANALLAEVAELNRTLMASGGQPAPNDLLDRRDRLVADLARVIGVVAADRPDGSLQLSALGTGILLVDGTRVATLAAVVDPGLDVVTLTAGGIGLTPRGGILDALLEQRNAPTGAVKQARADVDALARALVEETNRLHASGAGLAGASALTAANAVSGAAVPLTAAGLDFPPGTGAFRVITHDADGAVLADVTVDVTAGVTTLDDLQAALDAVPDLTATVTGGRLAITAEPGVTFAFADDTSGALAGLGLNTLFTGADGLTIAVNPVVADDVRRLATARADAAGLVRPGDGAVALDLARLRTALVLAEGTETLASFTGTMVSRVGSATRDAALALDRQEAALAAVRALQAQTAGVSTDEELISLTQAQTAYAAAARFITTMNDVLDTLLGMAR